MNNKQITVKINDKEIQILPLNFMKARIGELRSYETWAKGEISIWAGTDDFFDVGIKFTAKAEDLKTIFEAFCKEEEWKIGI